MKFFEYNLDYYNLRNKGIIDRKTSIEEFYKIALEIIKPSDFDPFAPMKLHTEQNWVKNKKPYYNVYPSIIPYLLKISLDELLVDHINLPLPHLLIRMPEGEHPINFCFEEKKYFLRTILVSDYKFDTSEYDYMTFWIDFGEVDEFDNWHVQTFRSMKKVPGLSINKAFDILKCHPSSQAGVVCSQEFLEKCAKLVCTLCLMADDREIITPEVLSCDEEKFQRTKDIKYIEKAKNRGKFGWSVGKDMHVVPHVRSASPAALYWTGPKKTIPKIRFRKGCVVHRKKIFDVPTGFLEDQND